MPFTWYFMLPHDTKLRANYHRRQSSLKKSQICFVQKHNLVNHQKMHNLFSSFPCLEIYQFTANNTVVACQISFFLKQDKNPLMFVSDCQCIAALTFLSRPLLVPRKTTLCPPQMQEVTEVSLSLLSVNTVRPDTSWEPPRGWFISRPQK